MKKPLLAVAGLAALLLAIILAWPESHQAGSSARVAGVPDQPLEPTERIDAEGPASGRQSPMDWQAAGDEMAVFAAWAGHWQAADAGTRMALMDEGRKLASARRPVMKAMIAADPRRALEAAVPYEVRRTLPAEILAKLETPVSGAGEFLVAIACGGPGRHACDDPSHDHSRDAVTRTLKLGAAVYQAFTYDDRLATTSKQVLCAHGVALDGLMAMHENPLRVLTAAEAADRKLAPARIHVELAGKIHTLPDAATLEKWIAALRADEQRLGPHPGAATTAAMAGQPPTAQAPTGGESGNATADSPTAQSAWTEGAKTMLHIRARFADEAADFVPLALGTAQTYQNTVDQFWQNASYGKTSLTTTYTDVVTLPSNASSYTNAFATLLADARSAALAANSSWNTANHDLYVVITSNKGSFAYAGIAYVGSSGAHLRSDYATLRTAGHEYGHNLGLWHANYWRTDATSPIGRDSNPGGYVNDNSGDEWLEYGHRFSLMSAQSGSDFDDGTKPHYSVAEKARLDWLTETSGITRLTSTPSSGTLVRIYRQDHPSAAGTRAVHVDVPGSDYTTTSASAKRRYWLGYRRAFTSGTPATYAPYGLEIDWRANTYGSDGAIQLDMTPYTRNTTNYYDENSQPSNFWTIDNSDKEDGQLPLGLTYSDPAGIHITPVAHGDDDATANNGNEWIEADVRIGSFPGNQPPVVSLVASTTAPAVNATVNFTATATDPEGDALGYWWDFGDNSLVAGSLNSPNAAKSWSSAAMRLVRVIVSDRKGGQTIAMLPVTVGSPSSNREIRGRVLQSGAPVANARVSSGTTYQTWTDSQGRYILTGLPSSTFTIAAQKDGLTFTAQFTNPVSTAGGNQYGMDFYANEPLASGGNTYAISGQVTGATGTGLAGVAVEAGGIRGITDSSGNYTIGGLPPATYAVTPYLPPYAFTPASRSVTVGSANSTGNNFAVTSYTVSGRISGVPSRSNSPRPSVSLLDGTAATITRVSITLGWDYSLKVPAGTYSVFATLSGYVLTPSFTNPLEVASNLSGQNITGTTSGATSNRLTGRVLTTSGQPVAGVAIALGDGNTLATITDDGGRYRFDNLAAASTTVSAARSGFTFATAAGSGNPLTPSSGSVVDFTATPDDGLPVVTALDASPSTVALPGGATLTATATGNGLNYHWSAIGAPGAVAFSSNDTASNVTTATLSAPGSHTFEVRVTDANGFTATRTVVVDATGQAGRMVVTPYETFVAAGSTVDFDVDAYDSDGAPVGVSPLFSVSGGGVIDPATGVFTAGSAGTHTVTATAGGLQATASVTVTGSLVAPSITTQPVARSVNEGEDVAFNVAAGGSAPLGYQWRRNGGDLANGGRISGANSATLAISGVLPGDAGNYSCYITNAAGNATSNAAPLAVNARPVVAITSPGTSPLALPDRTNTLALAVVASDAEGAPGVTWSQIDGPGTAAFATANAPETSVTFSTDGIYQLRATASDGSLSATGDLKVHVGAVSPFGANGLAAAYFSNKTLSGDPVLTRTDATVDFTWPGAPDPGLPADNFSVRWAGVVVPEFSETYTFHTLTDDGVRLYLDDTLVIDRWIDQAATEASASIACTAGVPVAIRMEYYEAAVDAVAQLAWSSASTPKAVIPNARLHVDAALNAAPAVDPGGAPSAVSGSAATLAGSVSDDGRPAGSVLTHNWTLLGGPGGVVFANPDSAATGATFSTGGIHQLRLTASDGSATVWRDLEVAVTESFAEWIGDQPGTGSLTAPGDDPDGDGVANLVEYALGTEPGNATSRALPVPAVNEAHEFTFTFTPRRVDGLAYFIESSGDMLGWPDVIEVTAELAPGVPFTHRTDTNTAGERRFLRLKVGTR